MRYSSKATTDDHLGLDVRKLQRDGLLLPRSLVSLKWSRSNGEVVGSIDMRVEPDCVNLSYRTRWAGQEWRERAYTVYLERTRCHLGGERVWFRCPANGCGRRVAILYSDGVFACRQCQDLTYQSCRESVGDRADRRAWGIREKCGDRWGSLFDPLMRPKGMHHRTFQRLEGEYNNAFGTSLARFAARMRMPPEALYEEMGG